MSINNELLEQYRAARTKFNLINEQQETSYHKRQRIILENSRTNAYKYSLIQSKRRAWASFRRTETNHSTYNRFRLSTNIHRSFEINKTKPEQTTNIFVSISINSLPPRIYPPIFNLRQVTSTKSMNVNILHHIILLGQFDRKFIISKHFSSSSNNNKIQIILFDQHAISERILLEHLQKENLNFKSFQLPSPTIITRNPRFLYTPEQIALLERTGFCFSSVSNNNLLVRSVPRWILSIRQRHLSTSIFDDIIGHTIDNILLKQNDHENNIDLIMYDTLKSLACHNAIKFNDILSMNQSNQLLNELKSCSMPFICAHGRTSAAILWEYDNTYEKYQVDMIELKQLASIHKWLKES